MKKLIARFSAIFAAFALAFFSVIGMTAVAEEDTTGEVPTVTEQENYGIEIPLCKFNVTGGTDLKYYDRFLNISTYEVRAAPKEIITVDYNFRIPNIESALITVENECIMYGNYVAYQMGADDYSQYGASNFPIDAYVKYSQSYTKGEGDNKEDIEKVEYIDLGSYESDNIGHVRFQLPYEDLDEYESYFNYWLVMHWNIKNIADNEEHHISTGLHLRVYLDKDAPICDVVDINASEEEGEDEGTGIDSSIINGTRKTSTAEKAAAAAGGAAAAGAAAGAAATKKKDESFFKMHIFKDFGDCLEENRNYTVYARITETLPDGKVVSRRDLTAQIKPFSSDNSLIVADGGIQGDYCAAIVTVPKDCQLETGKVSFQFKGKGGYFTENVIFKLLKPEIVFGQENLGLPAHYEKSVDIWFGVKNLQGDAKVTARFKDAKAPYRVSEPVPDDKVPGLYCITITDTSMKDEQEPGSTTAFRIEIKAESDKMKAEGIFDVLRVFMGLSLQLEGNALGCYLKKSADGKLEPCITKGKLVLLCWNDEAQAIERVAVCPKKKPEVVAVKVENDKNSLIGDPQKNHQDMVEQLKLELFPTKEVDESGARTVKLAATAAGLDPPARIRADVTVTAEFENKKYSVKKNILLHSLPFRSAETDAEYSEMLKRDDHITERLMNIRSQIYSKYLNNLFSLYYFIDRMTDGYDVHFGYDPSQVARVMDIWTGFLRGEKLGANADAEKVTLADELAACYAFMQGMRDNGGFLGRMALGICTAGYSEIVFFGMDLAEKMEYTIVTEGKDMDFWDGVIMGVKEYEKQLAMELLIGGALKAGNYVVGRTTGIDLAKTASTKYRQFMDAADNTLKSKSSLYKNSANILDNITGFSGGGTAASAQKSMENSAKADSAAKTKAQSIAQRRQGRAGMSAEELKGIEIHDLAMENGMKKVRKLYELQKKLGTARKNGNLAEVRAEYDAVWLDVKTDKNAFKALKRMNDPYAQTVRAEFTRVRKIHRQNIMDKVLDDVAMKTGKNRADLYYESVTSNTAWKEDAGLTMSEDLDLTIREKCYSERSKGMDVVIDQTIGEEAVVKRLYKEFHGGAEPPDLKTAKEFAETVDVTYVSPWMDQGNSYWIEFNPEAYYDVKPLTNKKFHGDELKGKALDRQTVAHKGKEWYNRGKKYELRAKEIEASAAGLSASEKNAIFQKAAELRYKADSCYVEGSRQIVKITNNTIKPRAQIMESLGYNNPLTPEIREMVAVAELTQGTYSPAEFFGYLKQKGLDFNQFSDMVSKCLE